MHMYKYIQVCCYLLFSGCCFDCCSYCNCWYCVSSVTSKRKTSSNPSDIIESLLGRRRADKFVSDSSVAL